MPDLFADLEREWSDLANRRRSHAATRRWLHHAPCGISDLNELVATVQRRDNPARSDTILSALARVAPDDELAARTLLQCLVPGLKVIAAANRNIEDPDELDAIVVAAAWERIRTYPHARRPSRVAANILLDCRQAVARTRNHRRPLSGREPAPEWEAIAAPQTTERLASMIPALYRAGLLSLNDARLIFLTRVMGFSIPELADERLGPHSLRQRRRRAERRLAAEVA